MNEVHIGGGAPSGSPLSNDIYANAGWYEPITEWSETGMFQVDYIDNVRLKIDRTSPVEIEICLWKKGDDSPYQTLNAEIPERFFVVRSTETGQVKIWSLEALIDEINRDRTGEWEDYTPFNWREGWQEFVEGKDYELITLESCTKQEAEQERKRQVRSLDSDHPLIAEAIRDGEESHLFTFLEVYEVKSFANGFAKAIDHYLDSRKFVGDDWISYRLPSGELVDIQFSVNQDAGSSDFNGLEAFAYQTRVDAKGRRSTVTDDCVRLI